MSDILWEPTPERAAASHLTALMRSNCCASYEALRRFSIEEPAAFWTAVWEDGQVIASVLPEAPIGEEAMPGTEWFPGAMLNFAENLLRRTDDGIAVIAVDESGARRDVSWAELNRLVAAAQVGLRDVGVGVGDRVAALLPNGLEALVAIAGEPAALIPEIGR